MDRIPVAVPGVSGRMGRMLVTALAANPRTRLVGATVRQGHDWIGRDLGACLGGAANGVTVTDDSIEAFAGARAILDFTAPAATLAHAVLAAQTRAVHVIGTTGIEAHDLPKLTAAARHAVIVRAGNMSLGVNVLTALTRRLAEALDAGWDIEIVEMHHRMKVDAPSGTALMLGAAAAAGRGIPLDGHAERGRDGVTGARAPGAIGFASLRGGDVVGEHQVIFAGDGERVVLSHVATDRMLFARGAIRAAIWGQDREPGEYTMQDVLGLG